MTAGNANEWGDDSPKNRFTDPDTGEAYFLIIDKETGKTKIYNEEFGADKYIGEFDPETNKINYNNNWWGGARKEEKAFFNNESRKKMIKDQAINVITRESIKEDGKSAEEAANIARKTMGEVTVSESAEGTSTQKFISQDEAGIKSEGALVYPETLRQQNGIQDTIKITALEYRASGFDTGQINSAGERPSTKTAKRLGTVILPIPAGIAATNETRYTEGKMSAVQSVLANAITNVGEGQNPGLLDAVENAAGSKNVKDALLAALATQGSGADAGAILSRKTGQIMNPNTELLFSGPALRRFSFLFQFAPRNRKEGNKVLRIIRFFKQKMAPQRSAERLFLKTPNTFEIEYQHNGGVHKGLNEFKECALQSCQIGYTPNGDYSTFDDGVMTGYTMNLGFQELDPVYNDNYGTGLPASLGL